MHQIVKEYTRSVNAGGVWFDVCYRDGAAGWKCAFPGCGKYVKGKTAAQANCERHAKTVHNAYYERWKQTGALAPREGVVPLAHRQAPEAAPAGTPTQPGMTGVAGGSARASAGAPPHASRPVGEDPGDLTADNTGMPERVRALGPQKHTTAEI